MSSIVIREANPDNRITKYVEIPTYTFFKAILMIESHSDKCLVYFKAGDTLICLDKDHRGTWSNNPNVYNFVFKNYEAYDVDIILINKK